MKLLRTKYSNKKLMTSFMYIYKKINFLKIYIYKEYCNIGYCRPIQVQKKSNNIFAINNSKEKVGCRNDGTK